MQKALTGVGSGGSGRGGGCFTILVSGFCARIDRGGKFGAGLAQISTDSLAIQTPISGFKTSLNPHNEA